MAVLNGEPYVEGALISILDQDERDLEVIVIDDGSTDGTPSILQRTAAIDGRVRVIRHATNQGLAAALNAGLAIANGEYVARQDADDVSLQGRLGRQRAFLDTYPMVAVVGCAFDVLAPNGQVAATLRPPCAPEDVRNWLVQANPFAHGSVMFRREVVQAVGGYSTTFRAAQDYDLWLRLAEHSDLGAVPETLYRWRFGHASVGTSSVDLQLAAAEAARVDARARQGQHQALEETAAPRQRLAGQHLWFAALWFGAGLVEEARSSLVNALEADPDIAHGGPEVEARLWASLRPWATTWGSPERGAALIAALLNQPPVHSPTLEAIGRHLIARIHIEQALEDYAAGHFGRVLRSVLAGARADLRWLTHRGVVSIGLRSLARL